MNYRTLSIIGVSLIVTAATGITLAISRKSDPASQVKSATTNTSNQEKQSQKDNAPVEEKETSAEASTTTSTNKPKKSSTAAPKTSAPKTSTVKPATPTTPPAPQPEASFGIVLREDDAYIQEYPEEMGIEQYVVPFDIIFDEGYVPGQAEMPYCTFLAAPAEEHSVLCNVSQKEADTGYLVMQYSNESLAGYYEVEVSYPIDGVTRTDVIAFELQDVQP